MGRTIECTDFAMIKVWDALKTIGANRAHLLFRSIKARRVDHGCEPVSIYLFERFGNFNRRSLKAAFIIVRALNLFV